jgi:hypothetical protein
MTARYATMSPLRRTKYDVVHHASLVFRVIALLKPRPGRGLEWLEDTVSSENLHPESLHVKLLILRSDESFKQQGSAD